MENQKNIGTVERVKKLGKAIWKKGDLIVCGTAVAGIATLAAISGNNHPVKSAEQIVLENADDKFSGVCLDYGCSAIQTRKHVEYGVEQLRGKLAIADSTDSTGTRRMKDAIKAYKASHEALKAKENGGRTAD